MNTCCLIFCGLTSFFSLFSKFLQVSLTLYNNKDYVDLSDYWKSGTWDIIEVPAYLNVHNDSQPIETDITFYITIRRKTLFYTVNLILPTVLISFLCVLVFYLPAEAGEKVTLGKYWYYF